MLDNLINGTDLQKGLFIMIFGLIGVFLVLVIFFIMIKLMSRLFPHNKTEEREEP